LKPLEDMSEQRKQFHLIIDQVMANHVWWIDWQE
jgi:hypothetical protein